jgi:AcrR family transcriptional regulator
MDDKVDTRSRILNAAVKRIKHYGYGKTTMAEIAADCAMSPGNIYRFFEAKIDLAEAMARQYETEQNARLSALARRKNVPADRRLREMLAVRLRENFALAERDPKLLEVAEILKRERPLYYSEELALQRVFLREVLADGMEAGLFRAMDVDFATEMVQAATYKFSFPHLFSRSTLAGLERELEGVVGLILNGLLATPRAAEAETGQPANEQ